jgi:hypothetical protein
LCCDLLSVSLDEADGRMLISVVATWGVPPIR